MIAEPIAKPTSFVLRRAPATLALWLALLGCQRPEPSANTTPDQPEGPPPGTIAPPPEVARPEPASVAPPPVHVNGARPPRPMPGAATLHDHDELRADTPAPVEVQPPPQVEPPPQVAPPPQVEPPQLGGAR